MFAYVSRVGCTHISLCAYTLLPSLCVRVLVYIREYFYMCEHRSFSRLISTYLYNIVYVFVSRDVCVSECGICTALDKGSLT